MTRHAALGALLAIGTFTALTPVVDLVAAGWAGVLIFRCSARPPWWSLAISGAVAVSIFQSVDPTATLDDGIAAVEAIEVSECLAPFPCASDPAFSAESAQSRSAGSARGCRDYATGPKGGRRRLSSAGDPLYRAGRILFMRASPPVLVDEIQYGGRTIEEGDVVNFRIDRH